MKGQLPSLIYAVNKDKYEIGKPMDFIIGALAYFAKEPESKGFTFEGQQAIDLRQNLVKNLNMMKRAM